MVAEVASRTPGSSSPRPRLVHVTAVPITQWQFLRGQNPFMLGRGFDVHAVATPGPLLERLAERDGVTVHPVPISRSIAPIQDLRALLMLWRLFRRLRPDIVHASTSKGALLGVLAARLAGVPVRIYHVRGLASEDAHGSQRRLFLLLERLTARLANAWLLNAPSLFAYARTEGVLRGDQGTVLLEGMANGIDTERFAPTAVADQGDDLVVGYIGRLTRDKGIHDLADAWAVVREEDARTRLLLVGPWEVEDPVSPDVRARLEGDPRVTVLPFQEDVVPSLARIDVFVYPSHGGEGFPNAPMEAAAMALPVIVTSVLGSVDAVVDGITGTVVPPRDARALAEAIRGYLQDAQRRRDHGLAGRERVVRAFRSQVIWAQLHTYYSAQLAARDLPGPVHHDRADVPA